MELSIGPGGQHTVAPFFGIPQPRMSELARGKVDRCSLEWLIERVHRAGGTVELTVTLGDSRAAFRRACFAKRRRGT